jgi:TusA-related sulfurtransferase
MPVALEFLHFFMKRGNMEAAGTTQPDIECDFRSLHCPNLLITVIKQVEEARAGQILRIIASDLNAPSSLGSWTRQSGHKMLDMYEEDGDFIFLIQCQLTARNDEQQKVNSQQPTIN